MNAIITNEENRVLVSLNGRLDTTNAQEFEKQIAELYNPEILNIEMDCSDFTYISSSGLRILLTLQKSIMARKGTLTLLNMRDEIKEVFEMTGFSSIFIIK
ncbi:MAG: STAS domain-containing protein [Rikenellaceae bacterium]